MMNTTQHTKSKGSVYKDLKITDAVEMGKKAEIVMLLQKKIKQKKLTQKEAAKRFHVSQPDLSKILNGRFRGYSVDRLLTFLTVFYDVELNIKEKKKSTRLGSWKVRTSKRQSKKAA